MLEYQTVPFTFVKQGVFYFTRKVPTDLKDHYTSGKISFSLRTRSSAVARARALKASQQLDEHWHFMRMQSMDLPGKHLLRMGGSRPITMPGSLSDQPEPEGHRISLSEAVAVYLRLKGTNRPATFHRAAERSCGYVIDACGDKDISRYTRADANAFRDALIERQLSGSSITRVFGTVRSVINFAASEIGITLTNPFAGVYYDRKAGVEDRQPLPIEAIRQLQDECRVLDDEVRWLVALVSDTGMRLGGALAHRQRRPRSEGRWSEHHQVFLWVSYGWATACPHRRPTSSWWSTWSGQQEEGFS